MAFDFRRITFAPTQSKLKREFLIHEKGCEQSSCWGFRDVARRRERHGGPGVYPPAGLRGSAPAGSRGGAPGEIFVFLALVIPHFEAFHTLFTYL